MDNRAAWLAPTELVRRLLLHQGIAEVHVAKVLGVIEGEVRQVIHAREKNLAQRVNEISLTVYVIV